MGQEFLKMVVLLLIRAAEKNFGMILARVKTTG